MKVVIVLEDYENKVNISCEFDEAVTDETRSAAATMASEMMVTAATVAKRWGGERVDD